MSRSKILEKTWGIIHPLLFTEFCYYWLNIRFDHSALLYSLDAKRKLLMMSVERREIYNNSCQINCYLKTPFFTLDVSLQMMERGVNRCNKRKYTTVRKYIYTQTIISHLNQDADGIHRCIITDISWCIPFVFVSYILRVVCGINSPSIETTCSLICCDIIRWSAEMISSKS